MRIFRRRKAVPPAVVTALRQAIDLLPADGDLPSLIHRLAGHRGRPITLSHWQADPASPSGLWVALRDRDHIIVAADAPPAREAAIICHELGHMLLGHEGPSAPPGQQVGAEAAPDIAPDVAARFLARHGYQDALEREAETFGTLLAAEVARRATGGSGDLVTDRLR